MMLFLIVSTGLVMQQIADRADLHNGQGQLRKHQFSEKMK